MSKVMYEINAIVGTYTNKDGQEKKRYLKAGVVLETKAGIMLKMDCIPIREGGWDGYAWLNPPEDRQRKHDDRSEGNSSDVPF